MNALYYHKQEIRVLTSSQPVNLKTLVLAIGEFRNLRRLTLYAARKSPPNADLAHLRSDFHTRAQCILDLLLESGCKSGTPLEEIRMEFTSYERGKRSQHGHFRRYVKYGAHQLRAGYRDLEMKFWWRGGPQVVCLEPRRRDGGFLEECEEAI